MQRTSAQARVPAAPGQATQAPVSITTVGPDGKATTLTIPSTRAEVRALLNRREQLSDQLISVSGRRQELAREVVAAADGNTRSGLEDRLRLLDGRILQLETDLATTGRQLALAPVEMVGTAESQSSSQGGDFEEGLMIGGFSVLLFMSIVLLFARRRWKSRARVTRGDIGAESGQRLERLEQGMDAIAIEIERVSEGQRFVTRLLSESQSPVNAGRRLGEPVAVEPDTPSKR